MIKIAQLNLKKNFSYSTFSSDRLSAIYYFDKKLAKISKGTIYTVVTYNQWHKQKVFKERTKTKTRLSSKIPRNFPSVKRKSLLKS